MSPVFQRGRFLSKGGDFFQTLRQMGRFAAARSGFASDERGAAAHGADALRAIATERERVAEANVGDSGQCGDALHDARPVRDASP